MLKLMIHDDSCGDFLDELGRCPSCFFHPDMQSTAFIDVTGEKLVEVTKQGMRGRTFLGPGRVSVKF